MQCGEGCFYGVAGARAAVLVLRAMHACVEGLQLLLRCFSTGSDHQCWCCLFACVRACVRACADYGSSETGGKQVTDMAKFLKDQFDLRYNSSRVPFQVNMFDEW